ncbi:myb/SANT-like DNA-binding domain-containing protein 4 [Macrobrachium nipponense]|uniref:myb/SANT-like DNA-binding domain-containing protein 4 n=1 Tax=Macrobrachium nipponense TaxID=159736 RepID=UPI0030C7F425
MFSVDAFFSDPKGKLNTIVYAKKSELLALAAKFEVTASSRDRKDDIKNAILEYIKEEEIVEEHEARKFLSAKKESSDVEHMRLAIQLEQVKLEADKERERQKLEVERQKLEIDKERKRYDLEMEKARLDHEASLTQNMEIEIE